MGKALNHNQLFDEVNQLIHTARAHVAQKVNTSLVLLYWQIGHRINSEILKHERAEYSQQIVKQLASQLHQHHGRGFNERTLFRMLRFAKQFPEKKIVNSLSQLLSWSHFIELCALDDPLKRQFYTEICQLECWSVRELQKKIRSLTYERTVISKKPEQVIHQELKKLQSDKELSQSLVFRDPYVLDLPANFSEKDLEEAILDELCHFLQEIGTDFCFIGRQKRITIDHEDYYIDLLMYHRGLSRLIAIELKLDRFNAAYKGQMELYLKWLDKYEKRPNENKPLGLILCADKNEEHIELLELDKSGIHVAQYLTELPEQAILQERLRAALLAAKDKQIRLKQKESDR